MAIRAFIAVELDDELRRQIAREQENVRVAIEGVSRVAWVRPASMHLTLKFLGDINESIVPALHTSIAAAVAGTTSIDVPLTRLGAFPRLQDPRNVWLGPDDRWQHTADARRLQTLVRAIDECCTAQGIPPEARPFSPHLTLGRIKEGERPAGRALAQRPGVTQPLAVAPLTIRAIALMKSQLDPKGAVHTRLWEIGLAR